MISEVNQVNNSTPEFLAKRKRGRPRKDESMDTSGLSGSDRVRRNRSRGVSSTDGTDNALVGQIVSGVLDGSFDAGYLLTVRVGGTGTLLRGVVFDPGLSVPVTAANDVAPHVSMIKRNDFPHAVVEPYKQTPLAVPQRPLPKLSQRNMDVASTGGPPPNQVLQVLDKCDSGVLTKGLAVSSNHIYQNLTPAMQPESTKDSLVSAEDSASQFDKEKLMGKLPSDGIAAITGNGKCNNSDQALQNTFQILPPKVMVQSPSKVTHVSASADGDLAGLKQASQNSCEVSPGEREKIPEDLERASESKGPLNDVAAPKGVIVELTNVPSADNLQEDGKPKSTPGAVDQDIKVSKNDSFTEEISKSLVEAQDLDCVEGTKESAETKTIEVVAAREMLLNEISSLQNKQIDGPSVLTTMPLLTDGLKPSFEVSVCEPKTDQSGPAVELLPLGVIPPVLDNNPAKIFTVEQSIDSSKLVNEEMGSEPQSDAPMSRVETYQHEVVSSTEDDLPRNKQFVAHKGFGSQIPDPTGTDLLNNAEMQSPGVAVDSAGKNNVIVLLNVAEHKINSELENLPEDKSGST